MHKRDGEHDGKLDLRAVAGIMVGHVRGNAYHILSSDKNNVIQTQKVRLVEDKDDSPISESVVQMIKYDLSEEDVIFDDAESNAPSDKQETEADLMTVKAEHERSDLNVEAGVALEQMT